MRLLANENFPSAAVQALRDIGHDVEWIRDTAPGADDLSVLAAATRDRRVLLTFDKDFGELAYRFGLPATSGVALFRIRMPSPERVADVVSAVLQQPGPWEGMFTVVEDDRVRRRALRPPPDAII